MVEPHNPCTLVLDHQKVIGAFGADIATVKSQTRALFDKADETNNLAHKNSEAIARLDMKLDNGISDRLKRIEEAMLATTNALSIRNGVVDHKLEDIQKDSWVTHLMGMGIKRFITFVIVFMFSSAALGTVFWGVTKASIFGEKPGQMQSLVKSHEVANLHMHKLDNGGMVVHSHPNPDGISLIGGNDNANKPQ